MKKYIKGAILLLVLAGLLLANISLDVNEEGHGIGVKISEVVAPPGGGGCATCGRQLSPSSWGG